MRKRVWETSEILTVVFIIKGEGQKKSNTTTRCSEVGTINSQIIYFYMARKYVVNRRQQTHSHQASVLQVMCRA